MDRIQLDAYGSYTVPEVADIVKTALEYVGKESKSNPLRYSASDVYWILHDFLRYVNAHTEGEFVLTRLKKGTWRLDYHTEDAATKKVKAHHARELQETADYIEDLSGRRPPWG
ncbi:MAG: hypothetical protein OXN17_03745 [Candidatus Poribacteria bacterium]|nr:hypothetical protein [Candidatus Poribacteria bacterium]MDE0504920.1 hypothetical protein [Candidatus Poribacteria bacterium]